MTTHVILAATAEVGAQHALEHDLPLPRRPWKDGQRTVVVTPSTGATPLRRMLGPIDVHHGYGWERAHDAGVALELERIRVISS